MTSLTPVPIRLLKELRDDSGDNFGFMDSKPEQFLAKDQVGLVDSDEEDYWIAWFAPTIRKMYFNLMTIGGNPFEVEDRLDSEPLLTSIDKDDAVFVPHFMHEMFLASGEIVHQLMYGSDIIYHLVPLFSISYEKAQTHALSRGFNMEIDCTNRGPNVLKRTIWCRSEREVAP